MMTFRRRFLFAWLLAVLVMVPACAWSANDRGQTDQPLLVFAAASLKNALDGVSAAYNKSHDAPDVKISYAGSSTLARQIEAGAPADIYISANEMWMDALEKKGLINPGSRYDLLGNSLVLVAPRSSHVSLVLKKGVDLKSALGRNGFLAMADTAAVPAGIYGKQSLQWLGVWESVKNRVAQEPDVRAALNLVALGQTPLGIVYSSDAVADKKRVRVVGEFPKASHGPIKYPVASVAGSDNPQDAAFLAFLKTDAATAIFKHWGFRVLVSP